jgi:hypothetical protein
MSRMPTPEQLSPAARMALVGLHTRRGVVLHHSVPADVRTELLGLRIVNARWALTGMGAMVRAACIDSALDEMEADL